MRKLKELNIMKEITFEALAEDWRVMRDFVAWCDTYSRHSILTFNMVKNYKTFSIFFERDMNLPNYIRKVTIFSRFDKVDDVLDFINTKLKRFMPHDTTPNLNKESQE